MFFWLLLVFHRILSSYINNNFFKRLEYTYSAEGLFRSYIKIIIEKNRVQRYFWMGFIEQKSFVFQYKLRLDKRFFLQNISKEHLKHFYAKSTPGCTVWWKTMFVIQWIILWIDLKINWKKYGKKCVYYKVWERKK